MTASTDAHSAHQVVSVGPPQNFAVCKTCEDSHIVLAALQTLTAEQAEDDGLWFLAQTTPEAYLQQELRRLHVAIERRLPSPPVRPTLEA